MLSAFCLRIQVDEPALREGLPLKRERWNSYLDWAVEAFRLATVVAAPSTQIVTHLCYSEFADILQVCGMQRLNELMLSCFVTLARRKPDVMLQPGDALSKLHMLVQ